MSDRERSIRQHLANGKSKAALDAAKDYHKASGTAVSEALLIDAYAARIRALYDQNLGLEAKSLVDLVRQRYPAAKAAMDELAASAALRSGSINDLVQPLSDPSISTEKRAAVEQAIRTRVSDLAALAVCPVLLAEHPLRLAATALDRAFIAVTSGTVTDAQLALPEVSHRSPLAPWAFLIRAIAYFHRSDDEKCRQNLDAILAEAAAARLVPPLRVMLGDRKPEALTPAASVLVSRFTSHYGTLRKTLEQLDRAFHHGDDGDEGRIFKAIRAVMQEARKSAPDELERLKRHIYIRASMSDLTESRLTAALEGQPRKCAEFYRLFARGMELSDGELDYAFACGLWDEFLQAAVRENWFASGSPAVATVYLHMADVLVKIPPKALKNTQQTLRSETRPIHEGLPGDLYYFYPEKVFQRACAQDPQSEAFSKWLHWAEKQSVSQGEKVAKEWSKALPDDVAPLLRLMEGAEKRNAFPTALGYLERAERADSLHPAVRSARLRLLAQSIITHLQKKKAHLTAPNIAAMAALPAARQGDRPAFLAALQFAVASERGDTASAENAQAELERIFGSETAALLLLSAVNRAAKRRQETLPPLRSLSKATRSALPQSIARIAMLVKDFRLGTFPVPADLLKEAKAQLPEVGSSLETAQLLILGTVGVASNDSELTYVSTGAGLQRGGPTEARFLLQRAKCLPDWLSDRREACAAAAAELGRRNREMDVVEQAVEFLRNPFDDEPLMLTADQADEVLGKEKAAAKYPTYNSRGPDYSDLVADFADEPCQCPDCRARRAEDPFGIDDEDEDDDEDFDDDFDERMPGGPPPGMASLLVDLLNEARKRGIPFDEIVAGLPGVGLPGPKLNKKKKKGRRR